MQMIAHDCVGMDGDRITFGHQMDACLNPGFAVLERTPGVVIDPAQECPAHASLDAMKGAGEIGRSDMGARSGHASIVPWHAVAVCR